MSNVILQESFAFSTANLRLLIGAAAHYMELLIKDDQGNSGEYGNVFRLFHSAVAVQKGDDNTVPHFFILDGRTASTAQRVLAQYQADYHSLARVPSLSSRLIVTDMDREAHPSSIAMDNLITDLGRAIDQALNAA